MSRRSDGPKPADTRTGKRYRWVWWGATALWMAVIFLASAWPKHGPPGAPGTDKVLHFGAYVGLTVLLFGSLRVTGPRLRRLASAGYAATAAIVYSVLLELGQLWVPGRDFQWSDILANCSGVVIAALILLYSSGSRTVSDASSTD